EGGLHPMPELKVISDFNFTDFLAENKVYKKYIRVKGQAMLEVAETLLIDHKQLKIKLNNQSLKNKRLILILKVKNEIYHVPVMINEFSEDSKYSYTVEKSGSVLCMRERRSYERVEINKKVEYYTIENRIQQFYKGVIEDISATGAKLRTKHELDTKYPVIISVNFLDLPMDELAGKIVWKEKKDNQFFNGIHFKFDDEITKETLINNLYGG
ncbi:MAG: PilZ domain-containing protein, partial [Bacillota bacterium]